MWLRPVASKVHPTDNLARDPNDTRNQASTTKKELCSFTSRPSRVSQGWQKNEKHATFVTIEVFNSSSKTKPNTWAKKFFKPESLLKHMFRAMVREWCNWSQKRWAGRQTNEVHEKTEKEQLLGDRQHQVNIFAKSSNSKKLKALNSK